MVTSAPSRKGFSDELDRARRQADLEYDRVIAALVKQYLNAFPAVFQAGIVKGGHSL